MPAKNLPVVGRGSFFDDAFFRDSWEDFDNAMKRVLDRFDSQGLTALNESGSRCQDAYRQIRVNKIDDDMYASQAIQVTEKDGRFQVVMDVRDFNPRDLQVRVVDERIVIEGRYDQVSDDGKSSTSKAFYKEFNLPPQADIDQVSTALSKDGVLTIRAPRKEGFIELPNSFDSPSIQNVANDRMSDPRNYSTSNDGYDSLSRDIKDRLKFSDRDSGLGTASASPMPYGATTTPSYMSPAPSEVGSDTSRVSTTMEFDVGKKNPYQKSEVAFKVRAPEVPAPPKYNAGGQSAFSPVGPFSPASGPFSPTHSGPFSPAPSGTFSPTNQGMFSPPPSSENFSPPPGTFSPLSGPFSPQSGGPFSPPPSAFSPQPTAPFPPTVAGTFSPPFSPSQQGSQGPFSPTPQGPQTPQGAYLSNRQTAPHVRQNIPSAQGMAPATPTYGQSNVAKPSGKPAVGSGGTATISVREEDGKRTMTQETSSLVQEKDGFLESKEIAAEVTEKDSQAARREAVTRMKRQEEDPEGKFSRSEAADASDVSESCVQQLPDGSYVTVKKSSTSSSNVKKSVSSTGGSAPQIAMPDPKFPMGFGNFPNMGRGPSLMSQMSSDSISSNASRLSNFSDMSHNMPRFTEMGNFPSMSGFPERPPFPEMTHFPKFEDMPQRGANVPTRPQPAFPFPNHQSSSSSNVFSSNSSFQQSSYSNTSDNKKF